MERLLQHELGEDLYGTMMATFFTGVKALGAEPPAAGGAEGAARS